MRPRIAPLFVLALSFLALWSAPASAAPKPPKAKPEPPRTARAEIIGTATYPERIALTPGAVFEARLEELSHADASARIIGQVRRPNPGQVPIRFEIAYNPRRIDPARSYVVRASIREAGRVRFTTVRGTPVITRGHGRRVTILLVQARDWEPGVGRDWGRPEPEPERHARIEDTRWRPVQIGGRTVRAAGQEPWIVFEARSDRVSGSGGCNRITGSYEVGGRTLRIHTMATTMMACPAMDTERAFLRALERTRTWRLAGRTLELMDDTGHVLAMLEEADLR